ncbi:MAG: subclass B3 metallo-beta-lactamase [Vicinamibacterales bacterium]
MLRTALRGALALVIAALTALPIGAQTNDEWTRPFAPFRIVGNIYWVGSYDLSTYLITTSAGNILINTGVGDTAQQIRKNVEQLGFRLSDTKILTATHGHFDHVAGLAELKKMTGARVLVADQDRSLLESGGKTDFAFGNSPSAQFPPVQVDGTFTDGDTISLGGTTLTVHRHAGHTRGATSFTTTVVENGKTYRVGIVNMGSINPGVRMIDHPSYPGIAYAKTFLAQKDLRLDIFLASHASQFRLHEKHAPGDSYSPERFVDPKGYLEGVQRLEKVYLDQVAKERGGR